MDQRRIRRARRKVLTARLALSNMTTMRIPGVGA
ncbi:DUF6284 family protein [Streptomyces mirabilis]